jgi:hypothetical protein
MDEHLINSCTDNYSLICDLKLRLFYAFPIYRMGEVGEMIGEGKGLFLINLPNFPPDFWSLFPTEKNNLLKC